MYAKEEVLSTRESVESPTVASKGERHLKLDPNGFPLRPQPSDDPLGMSQSLDLVLLLEGPAGCEVLSGCGARWLASKALA